MVAVFLAGTGAASAQQAALPDSPQAQAIPDSPRPQTLPNTANITPGKGAPSSSTNPLDDPSNGAAPVSALPASSATTEIPATTEAAPDIKAELGPGGRVQTIRANVNFVQIPFTVKDKSGALVPALDWREVQIFENGLRKHMTFWTSDPFPLSVAFVIDQSLPFDIMSRVNTALGALQGAFTPYDEMAIFTYNNNPVMRTDYTGAQSPRINAVISQSKTTGREVYLGSPGGPLSQTTNINGKGSFDPNTAPVRNSASTFQTPAKETHTLNDAIFMAAQSLAKRPDGRRRIVYVISDGKEYGSKAKFKDNIRYMQTNKHRGVRDSSRRLCHALHWLSWTATTSRSPCVKTSCRNTPRRPVARPCQSSGRRALSRASQRLPKMFGCSTPLATTPMSRSRTVSSARSRSRYCDRGWTSIAKRGYYPTPRERDAYRQRDQHLHDAPLNCARLARTPFGGTAFFALLAAACWGGGDFGGSIAVKRAGGTMRASVAGGDRRPCWSAWQCSALASLCPPIARCLPRLPSFGVPAAVPSQALRIDRLLLRAVQRCTWVLLLPSADCYALRCPAVVSELTEGLARWPQFVGFALAASAIWLIASVANQWVKMAHAM